MHHFIAISEFKLELQSGNPQLGHFRRFLSRLTLKFIGWDKKNRASLLYHCKRRASFYSHVCIQTRATAWKHMHWGKICFDLWNLGLWSLTLTFSWTSLSSVVIPPDNFMIIWWQEHSDKVWRTNRRTDGRTDWIIHRSASLQLKKCHPYGMTKQLFFHKLLFQNNAICTIIGFINLSVTHMFFSWQPAISISVEYC